jgi:hypothetical protein
MYVIYRPGGRILPPSTKLKHFTNYSIRGREIVDAASSKVSTVFKLCDREFESARGMNEPITVI